MNRIEHKEAAEALLELVPRVDPDADSRALLVGSVLLQRAQVHATLAAADVDLDRQARQATAYRKLCGCSFLPDPHIEGASCPPVGPPRAERVLPPGYRPQYAAGGPVPSDGLVQ